MTDLRYLPEHHLRRPADFKRAYARRRSAYDRQMKVFVCENGLSHSRLGLSVSRRVGNAVVRNRWKRLLREAFRLHREQLPSGLDLIIIPQPGMEPQLGPLAASLIALTSQLAARLHRSRS
jgi:ribonuclease P protein component